MLLTIISLILTFLAIQVLPVAIGIEVNKRIPRAILAIFILVVVIVTTFWLGIKVGNTFMYLMEGFKAVIVFIGFLLVGIRMLMEVFNVRKGERTYSIDSLKHIALATFAQGINAFLVGLLFHFIEFSEQYVILYLFTATAVVSIVGMFMKSEKLTLAFASLLYILGGFTMLFSSIYFSFFVII